MKKGRGNVLYEDIVIGGGRVATSKSKVEVSYDLLLNQGEVLQRGVHVAFRLGERRVIPGLEYGVEGMCEGGERSVRVGPHLAYRDEGVPGLIPPNAVLVFRVSLLRVSPPTDHGKLAI